MTKVTGPPAIAASTVAQNCESFSVFIVMNVTRKYIIKFGTYAIKNLKYFRKLGCDLKTTLLLRKNPIVSDIMYPTTAAMLGCII